MISFRSSSLSFFMTLNRKLCMSGSATISCQFLLTCSLLFFIFDDAPSACSFLLFPHSLALWPWGLLCCWSAEYFSIAETILELFHVLPLCGLLDVCVCVFGTKVNVSILRQHSGICFLFPLPISLLLSLLSDLALVTLNLAGKYTKTSGGNQEARSELEFLLSHQVNPNQHLVLPACGWRRLVSH